VAWESITEDLVNELSVLDFLEQSLMILLGWISHHSAVKVVKVDISRVNSKIGFSILTIVLLIINHVIGNFFTIIFDELPQTTCAILFFRSVGGS
jgi:hypothetical protein